MTQIKPVLIALGMAFALLATAIVPTANAQNVGFQTASVGNQEPSVAVTIWREAAERGNSSAQFMLGMYNAKGIEMPRNLLKAYVWLKLSAPSYPLSKALLKHVKAELTPAKISLGDFMVQDWKSRNTN